MGGFNSILVRLKDRSPLRMITASRKFQFHTGSIKRLVVMRCCFVDVSFNSILVRLKAGAEIRIHGLTSFQFHTGSIKSVVLFHHDHSIPGFNSILVRLKAMIIFMSLNKTICFNSILVRLKESIPTLT